jgi:hypothetical protein
MLQRACAARIFWMTKAECGGGVRRAALNADRGADVERASPMTPMRQRAGRIEAGSDLAASHFTTTVAPTDTRA